MPAVTDRVMPERGPGGRAPALLSRVRGKAFLSLVATGLATQGVTALSGPFVARMLGPHGRGEFVLVALIVLICSQIALGSLPAAVADTVARAKRPAWDVVWPELGRWIRLTLLTAAATALSVGVVMHGGTPQWPGLAAAGFLYAAAYVIQSLLYGMVQGEGNVLRINLFHLSGLSLYTVSVIVLFVLHPLGSAVRMLGLFTLCMCIGLFVGLLVLRQATGRRGDVAERDHLRSFARRGYLSGVGLLDGLGLDLLVVAILLGESALGLYQVAVSATNIAIVVFGPLSQMLLARLAGAADDPVGAAGLLRRWVLASVALDLLIVGGLEVVVGPVMRFAFGPRFYSIVPCARILIVGWALLGLRRVLIAVTQSQGNAGRASRIEVASLGLMLVLGAALARAVGTTGVAFAVAAAGASSCVALAVGVRWRPVR